MTAPSIMPPDPPRAPAEELEAALRSSCSALLAVEAIRADARDLAGEIHRMHAQLAQSIHELRVAIRALRQAGEPSSALSRGFVLPAEPAASSAEGDQATP